MMERYGAHLDLPMIGQSGQERLRRARVLTVGAGGLGSVALFTLAGMGIGTLGIADGDTVSLGNLNRQFLHGMDSLGESKVASAARTLRRLNPEPHYRLYSFMLDAGNAEEIVSDYDIVLAAVDGLPVRMLLNRACADAGVPLINGGVDGEVGTVQLVEYGRSACLACLYGEKACGEGKAVSYPPVVGAISAMMADCAVQYLLTGRDPLCGQLLCYRARELSTECITVLRRADCPVCGEASGDDDPAYERFTRQGDHSEGGKDR